MAHALHVNLRGVLPKPGRRGGSRWAPNKKITGDVKIMKAKEVIEMFLKGKTPEEIREVHELEKEIAQEEEKKAEDLTKIFVKESKADPVPEEPEAEEQPNEIDEMKKRIAELETQLKEAQDANTKKDMSEGVTPAEERKAIIDNMVRSFM